MKTSDNKKLNKEQLKAVKHEKGPLLIVAGAGTGKTTVITERIKWLISKKLATPSEILALTFTDKAAREMEERVDIALPYGYNQMWIMTFHSFGERVLRQEALSIGLDPGYKLMTGAESVIFFRKNLFKFTLNYFRPLGNPNKFIEGMLMHFGRLQDEDITPGQYINWAEEKNKKQKTENSEEKLENEKYLELSVAYKKYEELKVKECRMDFGDLITHTLKLFRNRKNILKVYQDRFKYILIDEFQDTNFAQNEMARLLAGKKRNITVVGDDDQAVYRWRGAAVSNIIQFREYYQTAKIIVLRKNYRSTAEILKKSYKLIQNNNPDRLEVKEKINKKLTSTRHEIGEPVEFIYRERVEDEAEETAKKIKNLKLKIKNEEGEEKYNWNDFAILVRANSHADSFTNALSRLGIPFQFLGPGMLFRQPEVKDLIAYLTLLNDLGDSVAIFRVLSMPIFKISVKDIALINNFARRVGLNTYEALDVLVAQYTNIEDHWSRSKNFGGYLPHISPSSKDAIIKVMNMIERHLDRTKKDSAGQILYYFLEDSGLLKKLTEYKSVQEEKTAVNVSKFFDKLKTYEAEHEDASVTAVVDWVEMAIELGESPLAGNSDWVENDTVNILTVHASKGLEFPIIFIVNLVNQRFPTSERREKIPIPDALVKEILPVGDYHMEEERRLFYVGMTRARDRLFFTAANYYGEGKRERKLSPFIEEALGKEDIAIERSNHRVTRQLNLLEWKKNDELPRKIVRQPINYLSYSQIDTFLTCTLQYKYRYILKIPVPQSSAGSFGSSMHLALQKFYEDVKKGMDPAKEQLLKFLEEVWIPVGYGTKAYESEMKNRGKIMLTAFYEKAYDPKIIPKSLEQVFKIRLTPVLTIGGKIDRVDLRNDGKLEIIDYKTGKRPTEKAINESLQLTVYGLAATDPSIYNKKIEDVILSFYFFDAQEFVSTIRTKEQLEEAKKKLLKTADEIERSDFVPKVGPWCDFCDFRLICEAWQ